LTGDLAPANSRLLQAGVALVKRSVVRRVTADAVTVEDRWSSARQLIPAAVLVDAGPALPDDALWRAAGGPPAAARDPPAPRGASTRRSSRAAGRHWRWGPADGPRRPLPHVVQPAAARAGRRREPRGVLGPPHELRRGRPSHRAARRLLRGAGRRRGRADH